MKTNKKIIKKTKIKIKQTKTKTKKTRKKKGGSSVSNQYETGLKQIFPPPTFYVQNLMYSNGFRIYTKDEECLMISFKEDHIFVDTLDKCEIKGSQSLQLLEKVGELFEEIKYISLNDESKIALCYDDDEDKNISIRLDILKILTKGQSWYNSLGYVSDHFDEEIQHNREIINMNMMSFYDKVFTTQLKNIYDEQIYFLQDMLPTLTKPERIIHLQEKIKKVQSERYSIEPCKEFETKYAEHIEKGFLLFLPQNEMEHLTVKQYFNTILTLFSQDANNVEKCKWLRDSMDYIFFSTILLYHNEKIKKMVHSRLDKKRKLVE
jgi:hypothetical protein